MFIIMNLPLKNNETVILTDKEVFKMIELINEMIFNTYPVLREIYKYLTGLTKVLIKNDLPFTWSTPSGLVITQHYKQSETKKISLTILGKNKTVVLKNWVDNSMDKRKQVGGIIPNIIHSFDASHLIEIINSFCSHLLFRMKSKRE